VSWRKVSLLRPISRVRMHGARKRIVIDATPLLYTASGIGRSTRKLIETILSLKHDEEIVLFGRRMLGRRLNSLGLPAKTVHIRAPRMAEAAIRSLGLVEGFCHGDLYHATDFYMPVRDVGRTVASIHDLIFLIEPEDMPDHIRLARWVPDFVRRCRHIITPSNHSKTDIVNRLGVDPAKVDVVYWGVDRSEFKPEPDGEGLKARLSGLLGFSRPYFLAVSCSTGRKNTPFLLRAYSRLLRDEPEHDLVLVWEAPESIRDQYTKPGVAQRIHFIGRQGDQALRDLYCGATAVLFPSLYEGFGLPILEAMSCGTPVITSNVTSMPEVGGEAAVYVNPRDEESLLSALEAFENRDPRVQGLRDKSLRQASLFTWERCAQETLAAYTKVLNAR